MIGIFKFLKAADVEITLDSYKVHLACISGTSDPLDVFLAGGFKEWQEFQRKRNFKCNMILSLIDMGQQNWLFAGVYKVLDCKRVKDHWEYSTELLAGQKDLIGRIIVHHKRAGRASYLLPKPQGMEFPIVEILRKKLNIEEFPGYNAVVLPHSKLRIITEQKIASWHGALASVKGVYLVTDTSTGNHYVGKAAGDEGIWKRWNSYADNGHGGNKGLKKVLKEKGPEHKAHFQYSILEIADTHASDQDVIAREAHWKNVLRSRGFGLNEN